MRDVAAERSDFSKVDLFMAYSPPATLLGSAYRKGNPTLFKSRIWG